MPKNEILVGKLMVSFWMHELNTIFLRHCAHFCIVWFFVSLLLAVICVDNDRIYSKFINDGVVKNERSVIIKNFMSRVINEHAHECQLFRITTVHWFFIWSQNDSNETTGLQLQHYLEIHNNIALYIFSNNPQVSHAPSLVVSSSIAWAFFPSCSTPRLRTLTITSFFSFFFFI